MFTLDTINYPLVYQFLQHSVVILQCGTGFNVLFPARLAGKVHDLKKRNSDQCFPQVGGLRQSLLDFDLDYHSDLKSVLFHYYETCNEKLFMSFRAYTRPGFAYVPLQGLVTSDGHTLQLASIGKFGEAHKNLEWEISSNKTVILGTSANLHGQPSVKNISEAQIFAWYLSDNDCPTIVVLSNEQGQFVGQPINVSFLNHDEITILRSNGASHEVITAVLEMAGATRPITFIG